MRDGRLSPEGELMNGAVAEPARYEFQSFLSDDEEDASEPTVDPAAEPVAKLAATDSPAPKDEPEKSPIPKLPPIIVSSHKIAATKRRGASVSTANGHGNRTTDGVKNGIVTNRTKNGGRGNVKLARIEVTIPWLSHEERAAFEYMEVDDGEDELALEKKRYPRRRRGLKVSDYFSSHSCVIACADGHRRLFLG